MWLKLVNFFDGSIKMFKLLILLTFLNLRKIYGFCVVYFDWRMGAPHAVRWSKSILLMLKQVFPSISITNRKKEMISTSKQRAEHPFAG